jgi:hypothetical protein
MRKSTVVILNQLNIKNNKIDKDNFEKNHNKKNHAGKHYSNPQCFKEKNYEAKFSTSSIYIKKINKDNSGKKKQKNHKK